MFGKKIAEISFAQIDRIFKIKSIVPEIKQNDDFFMRKNIFVWIDIVNGYDGVRKSLGCFLISQMRHFFWSKTSKADVFAGIIDACTIVDGSIFFCGRKNAF